MFLRTCPIIPALVIIGATSAWGAADPIAPARTGAQVWHEACAACHAEDGAGQPRERVGFEVPLPDLRDCSFATAEPAPDWFAVVHEGGPVRGLDRLMPAFGEILSAEEITAVVDYLRGFCPDLTDWPIGDLNLPRALFTEKAFPENEVVLTSTIAAQGPGQVMNELIYEQRLGARSMLEVGVPFGFLTEGGSDGTSSSGWTGGLGDLGASFKQVLIGNAHAGTILSIALDASFPTGRTDRGLGSGVTVFSPFVAFGQLVRGGLFVQAQGGADLPVSFTQTKPELFWRVALGRSFTPSGFGRMFTPIVEVLGTRELDAPDATVSWNVAPELQVTLSRRKHVRVAGGARMPLNQRQENHVQAAAYLLWDWSDGNLFKGW